MKKIIALFCAAAVVCGALSFAASAYRGYDCSVDEYPAFSASVHEADSTCSVIVKTNGVRPDFRALHPTYTVEGPDDTFVLCFDDAENADEAIGAVQTMRGVEYAEPNGVVTAQGEPSVQSYATYGASQMRLEPFADALLRRGSLDTVTVAVVDSGIVADLPVFNGRLTEGKSFIRIPNETVDPEDDAYMPYNTDEFGHGTSVASIIADCTQDLPVQILPIKVLGDDGNGTFLDTANGIRYAAEQGAKIVNLSFVATSCSLYLHDAVDYVLEEGGLTVTAAGNYGLNMDKKDCCPAHLQQGIVVSGFAEDGSLYKKSCYGSTVDLCAPAVDVPCTRTSGGIGYADGTSFAAPHVSAVAAMLKLYMPSADADMLSELLIENARDLGDAGFDTHSGWGVPDLSGLDGLQTPSADRRLVGIAVQSAPEKCYYKDSLNTDGFAGTLLYSDGTAEIYRGSFTYPRMTMSDVSALRPGRQTVTVSAGHFQTSFDVTVRLRWWQWLIWIPLFGFLWY